MVYPVTFCELFSRSSVGLVRARPPPSLLRQEGIDRLEVGLGGSGVDRNTRRLSDSHIESESKRYEIGDEIRGYQPGGRRGGL